MSNWIYYEELYVNEYFDISFIVLLIVYEFF